MEEDNLSGEEVLDGILNQEEINNLNSIAQEEVESIKQELLNVPQISEDAIARYSTADWIKKMGEMDITIIGCGGIGSNAAMSIAHTNPKHMTLIDGDYVSGINLAGQFFDNHDINQNKVYAMERKIHNCHNFNITAISRMFRYNRTDDRGVIASSNIIIGALDNMDARKAIFDVFMETANENTLLVDGRLSADTLQIFAFRKKDTAYVNKYKNEWLFDSSEADPTVCSYKQTYYCATLIGALITNICINYVRNLDIGTDVYPVSFLTEYDSNTMLMKN